MRSAFFKFVCAAIALLAVSSTPGQAVPLHEAYDPNNPFARMIRGELSPVKVYEDEQVLAFMDRAPVHPGHVLVISKVSRARNLLEEDAEDLARLMAVVRRIGQAQIDGLCVQGFTVVQNNGNGQTVPHLHFHVIPRKTVAPLMPSFDIRANPKDLEAMAAKIRAALSQAPPSGSK